MATGQIQIEGLRELVRATGGFKGDLAKEIRSELGEAGKIVSAEARVRFSRIDARTAMGIRPQAKATGRVAVQQRRGRVTGNRGDFGALQMRRALVPALGAKREEVLDQLDGMLERLAVRHGF